MSTRLCGYCARYIRVRKNGRLYEHKFGYLEICQGSGALAPGV